MPKVKKKRMSFVIDMTPLVDITFLLLTFLMFTAKFKSEAENKQSFTIERPYASADTTKLPEKDLCIINLDIAGKDTVIYYSMTNQHNRLEMWNNRENQFSSLNEKDIKVLADLRDSALVKVDTLMLQKLIPLTRSANRNTVFAIDADRDVSFEKLYAVMDIMRRKQANKFHYVTEKKKNKIE